MRHGEIDLVMRDEETLVFIPKYTKEMRICQLSRRSRRITPRRGSRTTTETEKKLP
jgi:Holliday junction resolvase-like predicted endonuclease